MSSSSQQHRHDKSNPGELGKEVHDSVHSAKRAVQEVGTKAREAARESYNDVRSTAMDKLSDLKSTAADYLEQGRDTAMHVIEQGRDKAIELEHTLEGQIQQRPVTAVLIAAGFGFCMGMLFMRPLTQR